MMKPRQDRHFPTAAQINELHEALRRVLGQVPFPVLGKQELLRDGSHVFLGDAELIGECITTLTLHPALFPDPPVSVAELAEGEASAAAWHGLGVMLHSMGTLAMQNALHARAGTVQRCKLLVDAVLTGARRPYLFPHLEHFRRLFMLGTAMRAYYADRSKRRKRPAAQEAPPKKQPDRAAQRRKDRTRSLLGGIFSSL